MGNLITYNDSFDWGANLVDRGNSIENLSMAIDAAMAFGDRVYCTPDFYDSAIPSGKIFEDLTLSSYDIAAFSLKYPWISQTQYEALMSITFILQTTENNSQNLVDLNGEFPQENNGLVGLNENCAKFIVYDLITWNEFHRLFVHTFSFAERCQEYQYFIRFFKPNLEGIAANQINRLIRLNRVNSFIKRVDLPGIPNEKIHIHFADKNDSALNIDGTWKHHHCTLPMEVREILSEWGFLLPKESYSV